MMKKVLSVFLTVVMLLSTISCISTTVFATDYPTLGVGEHIVQTYEYFYFNPEMDGYYRIKSINNDGCSPSIEMRNTEDESDYYDSFDEDNLGCEFELVVHFFADTYYICKVEDFFSMDSGEDINISIEYLGEDYEDDDDIVDEDYPTLGVGEHSVEFDSYFYFKTEEEGYYKIYSFNNGYSDPYIDMKHLLYENSDIFEDDADDYNFEVVKYFYSDDNYLCCIGNYGDGTQEFIDIAIEYLGEDYEDDDDIVNGDYPTLGEGEHVLSSGSYFYFIPDVSGYYKFESNGYGDPKITITCNGNEYQFDDENGYDFFGMVELEAGEEVLCYLYNYDDADCVFTISKTKDIESIEFNLVEPIEIIEYTNGYWAEDEIWDDELEDSVLVEYYHYYVPDGLRNEGNSITVNYKDGTSDVYTFNYNDWDFVNADGDVLNWDYEINQSYHNQWTLGSDNYIIITCYGKEILVPVTIIESPCESIEFNLVKPIEIIENTNGEWREDEIWDDDVEEWVWVEYYRYWTPELGCEGNSITVNYKDGTSDVYTFNYDDWDFVNADGDVLDWDYETDQSYYNQWTVESDNYIIVTCYGKETQVPVTIIENLVESIEFNLVEPIEIIENTNGYWEEAEIWDDDVEEWVYVEYYQYHSPDDLWNLGNSITVNYKDGTSDVYYYNGNIDPFVNADGDWLYWGYESNQSYYNQWTVGSDNYLTITCCGKETQVPVTIIENPVESIEFNLVEPLEIIENTNGEWREAEIWNEDLGEWLYFEYYHYYTPEGLWNEGNSITVNYTDGTSDVYIYNYDYNDFVNADGDCLDWDCETDQYYNQWTLGSDNYITVTCYGKETFVPVKIVKDGDSHEHISSDWIIDRNATCTVPGSKHKECTECGEILETDDISSTGHTTVKDAAIEATCTATGKTEGSHCSVCNTVIVAQTVVPAKGHTTVKDAAIEATCTATGKTEGSHCSVCNTVIVAQTVIPAKGHTTVKDAAIAATCTTTGKTEGSHCSVCNTVIVAQTVIPAKGHTTVKDAAVEATCTATGKTEGSHCSVCNTVIVAQTVIPAKGHTSSNWIVDEAATVSAPGSQHKECTICDEVLETAVIAQLKPATPKVATTNEIDGINITWNAVDGAVKYNVYRRQGGSSTWVLVGTTTATSLRDKNVSSGIYYVYSVRAYNSAGQYSDFISANTQTRKFMAVPKLTGISNATNGLYIKWNAVAGVTNGYRVYRRGAGSTYWTYLGTTKNTYYTDTAVKNKSGEYYRYTVIADGGYHSKFDTTGLYLRRLANPTLNSAVSSKSGITVKWSAVQGTTGYYVYRKTANSGWVRVATIGGTNNTTYLDKTAQKGVTYTYTVRAVCGYHISYFNSGISCYDKY